MENLVQRLELLEKSKLVDGSTGNKQPRSVYKGGKHLHRNSFIRPSVTPLLFYLVYKCGNKFKAQIQISRVQHYLGLFDDELQAALAYDNHARVRDSQIQRFDSCAHSFDPPYFGYIHLTDHLGR